MKPISSDKQNTELMNGLLKAMVDYNASDLFLTHNLPPTLKINGEVSRLKMDPLDSAQIEPLLWTIMTEKNQIEFEGKQECNFALHNDIGRFRVNLHYQQGHVGSVIRRIKTDIPSLEELSIPQQVTRFIEAKRGLLLVCGSTGSGKSSTLASLIDHRNANVGGHILTIEDPVEFVHVHKKGIINQREVGLDTISWDAALVNALRQAPDVIMIGEIRDAATMRYALTFADTGHLCVGTLHTNSASQAIERILSFFPEHRDQTMMELSMCLTGILSQRLLKRIDGKGRVPAVEIMTNSPFVQELIRKGELHRLKEAMEKNTDMLTFDNCLLNLLLEKKITEEEAFKNADSAANLKINYREKNPAFKNVNIQKEGNFGGLDGGLKIV